MSTSPRSRTRATALLAVLCLATLVRGAHLRWMLGHPLTARQLVWTEADMAGHWAWAGKIRQGDILSREPSPVYTAWMERIAPLETWDRWRGGKHVFNKAPLYPYLLAGMRFVSGDSLTGVGICQLAMGVLNVLLVFLVADRFFGLVTAVLAGIGAAIYGPALLYESLLLRDGLAVTVSLLLLWGLSRCTGPAPGRWFVAGLLAALALLGRELTLLFLPFIGLWAAERFWGQWRVLGRVGAAFALGVGVGILPLVARNLAVGAPPWALSALGNEGIIYGHAAGSTPVGFHVPESAAPILHQADGSLVRAIELTLQSYQGDWARLGRHELTRVAAVFAGYEPMDNANWYYYAQRSALLGFALCYEVVVGLGLLGLWLARGRARQDQRILVYFLVSALAGLLFTSLVGRYRLVPAAVLLVYAGVTLEWLGRSILDRRFSRAAAAAVIATGLVLLSARLLPPGVGRRQQRAVEPFWAASGYRDRGELSRAYGELEAGLEAAFDAPEPFLLPRGYLPIARVLLEVAPEVDRSADAARLLERLAERYPGDVPLRQLRETARRQAAERS